MEVHNNPNSHPNTNVIVNASGMGESTVPKARSIVTMPGFSRVNTNIATSMIKNNSSTAILLSICPLQYGRIGVTGNMVTGS